MSTGSSRLISRARIAQERVLSGARLQPITLQAWDLPVPLVGGTQDMTLGCQHGEYRQRHQRGPRDAACHVGRQIAERVLAGSNTRTVWPNAT